MKRKGVLIAILAAAVCAPIGFVLAISALFLLVFGPAASGGNTAACPGVPVTNVNVPDGGMVVKTTSGTEVSLDAAQVANAANIISVGQQIGVSSAGLLVAMVVVFQESKFRMYANSTIPESLSYPHDAVGSDHDSLNEFQQRANWGTVKERMDPDYAARAFFGGPSGPNGGSPRGLLDIPAWELMTPGKAAQTVQVSAFPDAYDKWVPAGKMLVETLSGSAAGGGGGACPVPGSSGEAVFPLEQPFNMTSGFGPRDSPAAGASTWHPAVDLQNWPNPCGRPVYAMLPGEVTLSSALFLSIKSPEGFTVSYLHMYKSDRLVDVGDQVTAGQQIGAVGNVAPSSGCHLDIRVNVAGNTNPEVAKLHVYDVAGGGWLNPIEFFPLFGIEICPSDRCSHV